MARTLLGFMPSLASFSLVPSADSVSSFFLSDPTMDQGRGLGARGGGALSLEVSEFLDSFLGYTSPLLLAVAAFEELVTLIPVERSRTPLSGLGFDSDFSDRSESSVTVLAARRR